jgi:Putative zinc-finger
MDHIEAVQRQAADRYLLGELSETEIREFEEHYFACPDCATELESAAILVENSRAVFHEFQPVGIFRRATGWRRSMADLRRPLFAIPAFAACALACVCVYQAVLLAPSLQQVPAFALAGRTRGPDTQIVAPRGVPVLAVSFDIDPRAVYPKYRCELQDSSGSTRFTASAAQPAAGEPITLLLPARKLESGKYKLAVSGAPPQGAPVRISDYNFDLSFK